jgi:hypothetical protein
MRLCALCVLGILIAGMAPTLSGQTASGAISGVIADGSGSAIAGAKVSLIDQDMHQLRSVVTSAAGGYEFNALPRGQYTLSAEMSGFKRKEVSGVTLTVAQVLQLDVQMELGQVTDSVTVEASAGQVQAAEASLARVIDEKRVRELPLNGRNFTQLTFLSSGIVTAGRASATQRQANYGPAFSAGGQRGAGGLAAGADLDRLCRGLPDAAELQRPLHRVAPGLVAQSEPEPRRPNH